MKSEFDADSDRVAARMGKRIGRARARVL